MDGFNIALHTIFASPAVFYAFAGVAWGIIGGALPGLSASITMALLLPFTFGMDPTMAIILLASTYVGAEYGGSIPAILIRTPGTSAAVTTVIDGYEMHKQGKSGEALGISLVAGVIGGLIGMVLVVGLTGPLSRIALYFTAPAFFALGVFGLSLIATLSDGSIIKAFLAAIVGLAISTIGIDPLSGVQRFTFGSAELLGGIEPILVLIGMFAMAELFHQTSAPAWDRASTSMRIKLPNWPMLKRIMPATLIGTGIGTFDGVTPGGGATLASFLSYNEARRWSKHPEEFGKGSPEGIAAPEAANNTVAATALIPTLTFGIPSSGSTAVLLGGLILHGIEPGPALLTKNPQFVYGLFGGLFIANLSQLVLGFLMLPPCIWLVNRPRAFLMAFIIALVSSGVYSVNQNIFDVLIMIGMGVLGYVMKTLRFPVLPLVLALVLGGIVERNYRRAVDLGYGEHAIFFQDPLSAGLLGLTVLFIAGSLGMTALRRRRERRAADIPAVPAIH
ncbi:tripartite tricarboxylate transporter permease [Terrihabitans rhizophilus]|uniref:Tripartite tricarboxylate transporter permease n=1 Tax=Terrihabitans rhizophilus TaxID=3092662 RepID=A0ABU4RIQ5_9HYPH|nr:tripartite tricarboxylate transporter permease [Terrihabitans sp. PJ23]MDX6804712.1 tripartite tricarboxylate transporter permease [Terrihabitans sp. PJ23]